MTRKEIEATKESLPKKIPGESIEYTLEEKQLQKELSCRSMINSILCYHGEKEIHRNHYMTEYVFDLGIRRVRELIAEQIADFRKANIIHSIVPGYNAIIWADEK